MTRCALYRHYDADNRLLYVGVTDCLSVRDRQHAATAVWHDKVARTETQWCLSRAHALALEAVAIVHEGPLYNVVHARKPKRISLVGSDSFAEQRSRGVSASTQCLIELADAYRIAAGLDRDQTVSYRVFRDSKKLSDLRAGAGITVSRFNSTMEWFGQNWPEGKPLPPALQSVEQAA
jgi:hypothetical protein